MSLLPASYPQGRRAPDPAGQVKALSPSSHQPPAWTKCPCLSPLLNGDGSGDYTCNHQVRGSPRHQPTDLECMRTCPLKAGGRLTAKTGRWMLGWTVPVCSDARWVTPHTDEPVNHPKDTTSLVVHWLKFCAPNAGGWAGFNP